MWLCIPSNPLLSCMHGSEWRDHGHVGLTVTAPRTAPPPLPSPPPPPPNTHTQVCGHLPVVMRKVASLMQALATELPAAQTGGGAGSPGGSGKRPLPSLPSLPSPGLGTSGTPKPSLHSVSAAAASPSTGGAPPPPPASGFQVIVNRLQKCVSQPCVCTCTFEWVCNRGCATLSDPL
jgi:hypothetical protein